MFFLIFEYTWIQPNIHFWNMVPSTCSDGLIKDIDILLKPKFDLIVVYTRFMVKNLSVRNRMFFSVFRLLPRKLFCRTIEKNEVSGFVRFKNIYFIIQISPLLSWKSNYFFSIIGKRILKSVIFYVIFTRKQR